MRKEKTLKRPMTSFVILSNIIFWILLALTGACMMLGAPEILIFILPIIAAWSSTFSLMILFKRIYPELRFKEFVKKQFKPKLRVSTLSIVVIIQVLIFTVTLFFIPSTNNSINFTLSVSGVGTLMFGFFTNLIRGPLGEELGWRGFALNELQKKHSPLMSALIVGALWGFWHTPLWFLTSGYTGVNLIKYCVLFMIGIISVTVIMTFFYNINKNLLVPIIIHQLFNFLIFIINVVNLDILLYTMVSYFIVAVILVVINPNRILFKNEKQT